MYIFLRMHMPRSEKEVFAMRMSRSEKEVFAMWSLRIDSEVCRVCRDFGLWSRMLGVWESVRDLVSDLGSLWGSWSRESVRDLRGDICLEREKNLWRDFVFISTPTKLPLRRPDTAVILLFRRLNLWPSALIRRPVGLDFVVNFYHMQHISCYDKSRNNPSIYTILI